jgi:hypothetical protein
MNERIASLWASRVPDLKHVGIMFDAVRTRVVQPLWFRVVRGDAGHVNRDEGQIASVRPLSTDEGRKLTESILDLLIPARNDWPSMHFR